VQFNTTLSAKTDYFVICFTHRLWTMPNICIWYSTNSAICKHPQSVTITQDLMRVDCRRYTGHSLNSDSTQSAQSGVLASVFIHSRMSVMPSNKGLWHTANILFQATFQLFWENTCMTLQRRELMVSKHSHLNGLPQHRSSQSATCTLYTADNTPVLLHHLYWLWLLHVNRVNFIPTPLPHTTTHEFWASY